MELTWICDSSQFADGWRRSADLHSGLCAVTKFKSFEDVKYQVFWSDLEDAARKLRKRGA